MCAQETQKTEENERGVDLNINIYYGGRGIIDDPTIYVINKMQEVLEELRVHVERYNLYDGKTNITTLPQTLKEADGIILAATEKSCCIYESRYSKCHESYVCVKDYYDFVDGLWLRNDCQILLP